ncbi:hypothetical protein BGZ76_007305 [Entomortierella beljakovae]|nr:hypothetical protein BGZ76_007305 [Entomortierella beljakovae]
MHPNPYGLPRKDEPSRENVMIRQNSTITELKLSSFQIHDHPDFWSTVRDLPNLKSLNISTTYIPHNVSEVFWQSCSRLSAISFYYTPMPNIPSSGTYSFDSIMSITLKSKQGDLTYQRQLELLKQCKGLYSIACHGGWDHMPLDDFSLCATKGAWPNLHELDLDCSGVGDDVLQVLLNALVRLSRLQVKFTGFGPNAFQALGRHFDTLKYLDIQKCKNVNNRMSHIIMCSCPNLIELQVTVFAASVIFEIDQQWVCTQLKSLKVYFDLEGFDMQTVILERLAGLTKLEYLDFGHRKDSTPGSCGGLTSIRLSLDKGLDLLRSCQQLTTLRFFGVVQEMNEQDLDWILESWKHLESVYGTLSDDGLRHIELAKIMESHGISVKVPSDRTL